jgi:hypothetical protein
MITQQGTDASGSAKASVGKPFSLLNRNELSMNNCTEIYSKYQPFFNSRFGDYIRTEGAVNI